MSFCYASFLVVNWHLHGKVAAIADWFLDDVPVKSLGHTICYYYCRSFIQVPSPNQKTASNSKKNSEITTKKRHPLRRVFVKFLVKKSTFWVVSNFQIIYLRGLITMVFCWWICKDILRKYIIYSPSTQNDFSQWMWGQRSTCLYHFISKRPIHQQWRTHIPKPPYSQRRVQPFLSFGRFHSHDQPTSLRKLVAFSAS